MEIGVIGDDMFTVGFRAVGIEKWFNVDEENNVDDAITEAMSDDNIGILVIHDLSLIHI